MKRIALLLSLLLPLAACQQTTTPATSSDAATATSPADATPSAAAEAAAAAANSGAMPADAPAEASSSATAGADAAVDAVAQASSHGTGLVPGTDYVEIKGGQPYAPLNGKIEVVEVFNFICPACARFEPLLSAWKRKLPADVRLTYVPADFNAQWQVYARAYMVAESMGLEDKTHEAVFNAIHLAHTLPSETDPADEAKVAAFYAKYGADQKQFLLASGVEGTPTVIVDGKYRVTGKNDEDVLRITNQLIAQERAANAGAANAAASGAAGR
jgi:thiol:disulfide interchange protein DsbA